MALNLSTLLCNRPHHPSPEHPVFLHWRFLFLSFMSLWNTHFPRPLPSPSPSPSHPAFCLCESDSSRNLMEVESHSDCLFCVWLMSWNTVSSRFIHAVAGVRLLPLPGWARTYHNLLIHSSIRGAQVASAPWLLWVMLLWTQMYRQSLSSCVQFFGVYTRKWSIWIIW